MKARIASALCVALPLICSLLPATAQFKVVPSQANQASVLNPPVAAKFSEFLRKTDPGNSAWRSDLTNDSANLLRSLKNLLNQRKGASAMGIQPPVDASQCAHIVVFEAPDVDSKMILEAPREIVSGMPKLQGLQACVGDFRGELLLPQQSPNAGMLLKGRGFLFLPEMSSQRREKPPVPFARPPQ